MIQGQIWARQVAASGVFSAISGHEWSRRHWPGHGGGQAAAHCGPLRVVAVFIVTAFCGRNAQNFCLYFARKCRTRHKALVAWCEVRWGLSWVRVERAHDPDGWRKIFITYPTSPLSPFAGNVHDAFASRCPTASVRVKYELTPPSLHHYPPVVVQWLLLHLPPPLAAASCLCVWVDSGLQFWFSIFCRPPFCFGLTTATLLSCTAGGGVRQAGRRAKRWAVG